MVETLTTGITIGCLDGGSTNVRLSTVTFTPDGLVSFNNRWFTTPVSSNEGLTFYPPGSHDDVKSHVELNGADGFVVTGAYKNPLATDNGIISGEIYLNGSTEEILSRIEEVTDTHKLPDDILLRSVTKIVVAQQLSREFPGLAAMLANTSRISTRLGYVASLFSEKEPTIPECDIEGFTAGGCDIDRVMNSLGYTKDQYQTEKETTTLDGRSIDISGDYPTTLRLLSRLRKDMIFKEGDTMFKYAIPSDLVSIGDKVGKNDRFGFKTAKEPFGALVNRDNKKILTPFMDQVRLANTDDIHYPYQFISDSIVYALQHSNLNDSRLYFLPIGQGIHLVEKNSRLHVLTDVNITNYPLAAELVALRDLGVAYKGFQALDQNPQENRKIAFYSGMFSQESQDGNFMIITAGLPYKYIPYQCTAQDSGILAAITVAQDRFGIETDLNQIVKIKRLNYPTNAFPQYGERWQQIFEEFSVEQRYLALPTISSLSL